MFEGMAPLSPSAIALAEILKDDPETVRRLADRIHRTMLWRYSTGRRLPDLARAVALHRLTGGRVPVDGWTEVEAA